MDSLVTQGLSLMGLLLQKERLIYEVSDLMMVMVRLFLDLNLHCKPFRFDLGNGNGVLVM